MLSKYDGLKVMTYVGLQGSHVNYPELPMQKTAITTDANLTQDRRFQYPLGAPAAVETASTYSLVPLATGSAFTSTPGTISKHMQTNNSPAGKRAFMMNLWLKIQCIADDTTRTRRQHDQKTRKPTCHLNKFANCSCIHCRTQIQHSISLTIKTDLIMSYLDLRVDRRHYQSFNWHFLSSSGRPRSKSITTPLGHFA